VFEGADGVGKSTLVSWFVDHLKNSGIEATLLSFPGRERGTIGNLVYDVHHHPHDFGIDSMTEASLQLLHVAAHIDAIERRIKPLLDNGTTVVLKRFWWSTLVYGLVGAIPRSTLERMIDIERDVWRPIAPTALFLVTRDQPLRPEPPALWASWRPV
jgi:dTMP kinase